MKPARNLLTCFSFLWLVALACTIGTGIRCAHPVAPTGGIKDIAPPDPVAASPKNYSTNFSYEKITITFDEFIQLKNPGKEIFISPPIKVKPEYKLKGKSLVVEFMEPLRENATYTINFGNAIVDLSEGNPLKNFEYVFATGPVIDSLSVAGEVVHAFDLKPAPEVLAMVYLDNNDTLPFDSLPLKIPPVNVSRTGENGEFRINNLADGRYKLFILEDLNNNFYHDLPAERIGFLRNTVRPADMKSRVDSIMVGDSLSLPVDSSLIPAPRHRLFLFQGPDSVQRMLGKTLAGREKITYAFRMPVDTIEISILEPAGPGERFIREYNPAGDTLTLWLRTLPGDTLVIALRADSLPVDTARFVLREDSQGPGQRRRGAGQHKLAANSGSVPIKDLNREMIITFSAPLEQFDTGKITLAAPEDTLIPRTRFIDSIRRKILVDYPWKEGAAYVITLPDSCAWSIAGFPNARKDFRFNVRSIADYGVMVMNFDFPGGEGQFILQLLNEKEKVLRTDILAVPAKIKYDYLLPGKYKIKAIADINRNGKWDTGNYLFRRLPEPVYFYPVEISVRANWELQEEWVLEAPNAYISSLQRLMQSMISVNTLFFNE